MSLIGPMPGATSVVGLQTSVGGSGGLVTWAVDQAVDSFMEGLVVGWDKANVRTLAHARVNKARDIGTLVHKQIELILTGEPVTPTAETAPYIYSYTQFLADHRPIYLQVERRVISPKNLYGGTVDALAVLPNVDKRPGFLDYKTGKPKAVAHGLQMAGYYAAEGFGGEIDQYHRYFYDPEVGLEPLPRLGPAYLVYLRPDGYELQILTVTSAARQHFLKLVKAYHAIRSWEKAA